MKPLKKREDPAGAVKQTFIESELGRISITVYADLASSLQPKERILTLGFTEIATMLATQSSYRKCTEELNRFYHRNGDTEVRLRTLSGSINRTGKEVSAALSSATEHVLRQYGFDTTTGIPCEGVTLSDNITQDHAPKMLDQKTLQARQNAIDAVNETRTVKIPFDVKDVTLETNAERCIYISIDDIGVKRQKDHRSEDYVKDSKNVENSVADIQFHGRRFTLTAIGMQNLMNSVLAFLLENSLLKYELVCFTDGARNIKSYIETMFAFHPYVLYLDWDFVIPATRLRRTMIFSLPKGKSITGCPGRSKEAVILLLLPCCIVMASHMTGLHTSCLH